MRNTFAGSSQESSRPSAKILICTFAPSMNPNYGGILQAWALQQTLDRLGYDSYVDDPSRGTLRRATGVIRRRLAIAFPSSRAARNPAFAPKNRRLLRFPKRRIKLTNLRSRNPRARSRRIGEFSGFVVGSDQVWRPDYSNVPENLFSFLPDSFDGPRIAYAASFGSDTPAGFDAELQAISAPLAQRLTAVSVRETSGIGLCRLLWGIDARRCIDPTMLIQRDDYEELAGVTAGVSCGLVSYVLDDAPHVREIVSRLVDGTGMPENPLRHDTEDSESSYRTAPSIEEWLRRIAEAEYVVTDSFHGCVFAILFNRRFLLVPNESRGLARFETLLKVLELQDRIASPDLDPVQQLIAPLDWNMVNRRIEEERVQGIAFLEDALNELNRGRALA